MTDSENKKTPLYERRWAKVFTLVVYVLLLMVSFLLITDEQAITWHKALRFYIFSAGWLIAYYGSRPKKTV